jgi:hypothetical protein
MSEAPLRIKTVRRRAVASRVAEGELKKGREHTSVAPVPAGIVEDDIPRSDR